MAERYQGSPSHVHYGSGRPDRNPRRPELPQMSEAERARMEFFRDVFEVGHRTYEKETGDASKTQQGMGLRAVDVLNEVLEKPFNIPKHYQNADAYARAKLGLDPQRVPIRNRMLRIFSNLGVGAVATGIDWMDARVKKNPRDNDPKYFGLAFSLNGNGKKRNETESLFTVLARKAKEAAGWKSPATSASAGGESGKTSGLGVWAGAYGAGLEYIMDQAVSAGADTMVRTLTKSKASYASPLTHKIYNISRLVPLADEFLNPTGIEAAWRIASNWPVLGAPVEALYKYLNDQLRQSSGSASFVEGLAFSMVKGQRAYIKDQEQAEFKAEEKEKSEKTDDKIAALELEAQVLRRNQEEQAEAIVTEEVPDGLKRAVIENMRARDEARTRREAASRSD